MLIQAILLEGNLYKKDKNKKSFSIWKKTGYLEVCLTIIVNSFYFLSQTENKLTLSKILENYQAEENVYKKIV